MQRVDRSLAWTTVFLALILSLATAVSPARAAASAKRAPNVLYLFADQWRAAAMGYAGDSNVKTPNLDKLAAQSVNFTHAVSVLPVCTPYRAALLTGRFPTSTGMFMNDVQLRDDELCMGEIFKQAGYQTGYIGKWHLDGHGRSSYIPPERRQGFDYWKVGECDHNYPNSHYYEGTSPEKKFWEGYDAFAQTKDAQQYVRQHAADSKPFLLVVSYGVPHFPHATAPQEFRDLYPPASIQLRPNVPEELKAKAQQEACGYYAHCTALDRCVGDLMATLKQAGAEDNTVVVFTSDHGEMLGSQGERPMGKQRPWDESIRVPFLLRYPQLLGLTGRQVSVPLNTPDILPTLLTLAGVAIPKTIEGDDLSGLVRGTSTLADRAALIMNVSPFADYNTGKEYRGIRTTRYTYVRSLEGPWLLYDNQADPYQLKNLVDDPAHAALRDKLESQLQAELKRVGDDFQPRQYYQQKFGYAVERNGTISYAPNAKVQIPRKPPR